MIDYGHDLQFGVFIAPAAQSADHVVALSALAEEVGYDLVTFNDHPYSPGFLDCRPSTPPSDLTQIHVISCIRPSRQQVSSPSARRPSSSESDSDAAAPVPGASRP